MHNVQQRQRLIPSIVYKQELAKCQLGDNIANHMGYIFTAILYDKFDMTFKQVTNFYSKTVERRKSWQDDDDEAVTSESMMAYCRKKKIDVVKWVKSIPMSQKLYMADIKKWTGSAWRRSEYRERACLHNVSDNSDIKRFLPFLKCQNRRIYELGCLLH